MQLVKTETRVQFGTSRLKCLYFVHSKWLLKGTFKRVMKLSCEICAGDKLSTFSLLAEVFLSKQNTRANILSREIKGNLHQHLLTVSLLESIKPLHYLEISKNVRAALFHKRKIGDWTWSCFKKAP